VISVTIRIGSKDGTPTKYFVSERLADPEDYVLLMLLNLFGLPLDSIEALVATTENNQQELLFPPVVYEEYDGARLEVRFEELNIVNAISDSAAAVPSVTTPSKEKKKKKKKKGKRTEPSQPMHMYHDGRNDEDGEDKEMRPPTQGPLQGNSRVLRSETFRPRQDSSKENMPQQQRQQQQQQHGQKQRSPLESTFNYSQWESQNEKVQELLEWDSRRLGFAFLTSSEMKKRGSRF
jgi:hypothetical protein